MNTNDFMARLGKSNLAAYSETLHKKVYPNGFTVLFQPVNHVASVSCGVYLRHGSSTELDDELGYFHIIEHMLFKGTRKRTSRQIVEAIEKVGGAINAVTSREYTSYYVSLIRDELPLALDILSDMVYNPLLKNSDLELEKRVIVEEIKSYEDSPEDFLYDEYYHEIFGGHPLGRNIAGTKESVLNVTESKLKKFYKKHYLPENIILSVSGNTTLEEIEELVFKFFPISSESSDSTNSKSSYKLKINKKSKTKTNIVAKKNSLKGNHISDQSEFYPDLPSSNHLGSPVGTIKNTGIISKKFIKKFHKRKIEQVNFYLGAEGYYRSHPKSPALIIASNILGGGMASRLFQEVREKKGYCYGIQCFPSGYHNSGLTSIFCATSPQNTEKAIRLILKEIQSIVKKGFSESELEYSITNIVGGLAMGYEMTESRMNNIAIQEIYYGKFYSLLDRIELISRVNLDELNQVFLESFQLDNFHLSLIGDLKSSQVKQIPH
ncbi:MAG: insulinase family protein [Leptospira sp.]|nr:insulinase family protein [Leptospira sp.]